MKNIVRVLSILLMCSYVSGCATAYQYGKSKKQILTERIQASADKELKERLKAGEDPETAIKALKLKGGALGIGINLANTEVLMKNPGKQSVAALVDLGTMLLVNEGIKYSRDKDSIFGDGEESKKQEAVAVPEGGVNVEGDGNNLIFNSGDGNSFTEQGKAEELLLTE